MSDPATPADQLKEAQRVYAGQVEGAVRHVVEMAENAENANQHSLSGWYGSVCKWIRDREKERKGFTLTLPDPDEGGDPLTVIEVKPPTR